MCKYTGLSIYYTLSKSVQPQMLYFNLICFTDLTHVSLALHKLNLFCYIKCTTLLYEIYADLIINVHTSFD